MSNRYKLYDENILVFTSIFIPLITISLLTLLCLSIRRRVDVVYLDVVNTR